jgi:parallel beta-helix repeat protein
MKKKFLELPVHHKIFFLTVVLAVFSVGTFAGIFYAKKAFTSPAPSAPADFRMPFDSFRMKGETSGIGTHFAITDSEYLNITLDSTETVDLRLTSMPKVITMMFNPATTTSATTTEITISGLVKNTIYYKYEDDYHHLAEFTSDDNGAYSYAQDISVQHFVFIQTRKSTKFIADNETGGDCAIMGNWNAETKTCTLTTDVSETVQIDSDGITLDGNGHTIIGYDTASGVYLSGRNSVIVKNLNIKRFTNGISVIYGGNNALINNVASNNSNIGILVADSSNNALTNNTASNNGFGIRLEYSNHNALTSNIAQENMFDIYVDIWRGNSCNDTIVDTTGSGGLPIKYFNSAVNLNNETFSELILCNADHSVINNATISGSRAMNNNGLYMINTDYSTITNVKSSNNFYGLLLMGSNNTLTNNIINNNYFGIYLNAMGTDNNILTENILDGNQDNGFSLSFSNNNTLKDNTISNSDYGISLSYSYNNRVYDNNFINNITQADSSPSVISIDKNYWSNYDTPAEGCNDANGDNICDAPYVFSGGQDNLPWTRQDGWKNVGQRAADLAKQLVNSSYLWGGKGWDFQDGIFVDTGIIKSGYTYWNSVLNSTSTGIGVDCSGLVAWSYDRSVSSTTPLVNNFIKFENADGQYRNNSTSTTEAELQPGDLMFFDWGTYSKGSGWNGIKDNKIDHVAEYVGVSGNYDIIQAQDERHGIATSTKDRLKQLSGFVGFKKPTDARIAMAVKGHSPINLTVTDPDGNTITHSTVIPSDEEYIREIQGELYYSEMEKGADGLPEDIIYSPFLKQGVYKIGVIPALGSSQNQTYSLDFIAGEQTMNLANNVPISRIPSNGYGIVVGENNVITFDTTPPEAHIAFSTSTKKIIITGTDDLTTATVTTTATSAIVADAVGNTLTLSISKNITQPNHAALIIPSFSYSTGTTTKAATSLRYFWNTDKKGKYIFFISAVRTPTDRQIMIYSQLTNKTYVVAGTVSDDNADLSLQSARLLLRKKIKTYDGLVIPSVSTKQGKTIIGF